MKTFLQKSNFIAFLTLFFLGFSPEIIAQTTYTWNKTVTASYPTSTNWTPTRTTPASTDILRFNNGATISVIDVPTQTIGGLLVTNNTNVTFSTVSANATYTTTIGNSVVGADLVVASGCQLNLSGPRSEVITLTTGATGSITGNMTFSTTNVGAHQLLAADASGITFNSPAVFTAGTGFTGSAFGTTGTNNTVIFATGSTYVSAAGANPFGSTQPNSKVQFQTGSLFRITQNSAPGLNGRTYANFEVNGATFNQSATGTVGVTMDNLTITAGILNLNTTGTSAVNIKGNISVASGATLAFSPASASTLTFSGTTPQTISNSGTLTFAANEAVVIANTASPTPSVTFNNNQTISGSLTVNATSILATSGTLTNASPAINGGLQLNSGGSVSATPTYGSASSLIYNRGSAIGHGVEWTNTGAPPVAGSGIPNNVTVQGSTALTLTASRGMAGNLSIESGSSVKVDPLLNLAVVNSISNNGTLTIENTANLIQTNNVANTGSGSTIVKRNSSLLKRLDYTLWSSPVTGQGVYAFSKYTLPTRFYVYDTANDVYSNSLVGFSFNPANFDYPSPLTSPNGVNGTDDANVQFTNGKSYLIRVPYNHPTAPVVYNGIFTGVANNGNISPTVSTALNGYNAVGNPYPSRLNVWNFIDGNTNITGPLYFWRKTNSTDPLVTSYATLTKTAYVANGAPGGDTGTGFFPTGGSQEQNWVINIGQGFIVKATSGPTISFTNSMRRSLNADQFFKNSQTVNTINNGLYWLNLNTSTGSYSQMAVGYSSEGTLDFDRGIDGENINKEFYLTSLIGIDEYSIQGRPDFDSSDIVPLSYKIVASGNYSISIDHADGLFTDVSQPIYLKDNLTTTIHDLNTGAYSFVSDAGTFTNRFEIIYALPLGTENPNFTANNVVVYNQNSEFVVNTGNVIMSSVKVFDIRGRLLEERKEINASQTTIGSGLANQVLLVQITSEDGITVTKKVIR